MKSMKEILESLESLDNKKDLVEWKFDPSLAKKLSPKANAHIKKAFSRLASEIESLTGIIRQYSSDELDTDWKNIVPGSIVDKIIALENVADVAMHKNLGDLK